jgi:hypothetical protein
MPYASENVQLGTVADITPGGVATALGPEGIKATWIKLLATGASIRVGDSNVGSARGLVVGTTIPVTLERGDFDQQGYYLNQVFVFGSDGDKVSVTYGV